MLDRIDAKLLVGLTGAADRGDSEAMFRLAFGYFGNHIEDFQVQTTWFSSRTRSEQRRAARFEIAVYWLCRAAESGHREALFRLGYFQLDGLSEFRQCFIPKDMAQAQINLIKAAEAGHPHALAALERREPTWLHPRCNTR